MPADHRSTRTRQRGRAELAIAAGALAIAAGALAGFAWSRPTTASARHKYTQSGQLSYGAPTSPNSIYGRAGLTTGDPIYAGAVRGVTVSYDYNLNSSEPTKVSGSEQLVATISNGQGLSRAIPLQQRTSFTGASFHATGTLSLASLQAAATAFDRATGGLAAGASMQVSITPTVEVRGQLGNTPFRTNFDDAVSFAYGVGYGSTPASLTPSSASPGATGGSATFGAAAQPVGFTASAQGSVQVPDARAATLLFGLRVAEARVISVAVLAGALLLVILFGRPLVGDATSDDEQVRIATRYGTSLIDVEDLPGPPGIVVVELSSFDGLREVARRLECPILYRAVRAEALRERDVYAVVDNGTLYRYTAGRVTSRRGESDHPISKSSRPNPAHRRAGRASGDAAVEPVANVLALETATSSGFSNNGHLSQP
ncbi:MAG: hypothetical protein WCF24_07015 [Acidimicrobiales bacterium]